MLKTFQIIFLCFYCTGFIEGGPRIIGGDEVTIVSYPYTVSVQTSAGHVCGGSILNKNVVASAAHCIRYEPEEYKIRAGSTYSYKDGVLIQVSEIVIHPKYNKLTSDADISLLILSVPLEYSFTIQPIQLPSYMEPVEDGVMATVTGWGTTSARNFTQISQVLRRVYLPTINRNECKLKFPPNSITNYMICAGSRTEQKDACTGDSGGPMVYKGTLIGLISWALACADVNNPGVYTYVASVVDFILSNLDKYSTA